MMCMPVLCGWAVRGGKMASLYFRGYCTIRGNTNLMNYMS